jgi:hypothetical protein
MRQDGPEEKDDALRRMHVFHFQGEEDGLVAPKIAGPGFRFVQSDPDFDPAVPGGISCGGVIVESLHSPPVDRGDRGVETVGCGHGEVTDFVIPDVRDPNARKQAVGNHREFEANLRGWKGGRKGGRTGGRKGGGKRGRMTRSCLSVPRHTDTRMGGTRSRRRGKEGGREGGREGGTFKRVFK